MIVVPLMVQEHPVCAQCNRPIEPDADRVFVSACEHSDGVSLVMHGYCALVAQEQRQARAQVDEFMADAYRKAREQWPVAFDE